MSRVLITGGRKFNERSRVFDKLDAIFYFDPGLVIIQGGATGADHLALTWCRYHGVPCITMEAMWNKLGNKAGGIRNQWMIDHCSPNYVVAFPGGFGTNDMRIRARKAGVPVYEG